MPSQNNKNPLFGILESPYSSIRNQLGQRKMRVDVTMGSFDGAELCELVRLYILHLLSSMFNKDQVGLYRDDGLAALKLYGPEFDRARKDIVQTFKDCDLHVTVEILLHQTDFLAVTFDLPTGRYRLYRKPNNEPLYIHPKGTTHLLF